MRRALKQQGARAVFGPAGKRRLRVFTDAADAAELTRRISRARLLAVMEGEGAVAVAVWRAGKVKVELELPRVLRSAAELQRGQDAARRLAKAFEGEAPGAIKAGTAAVDLAASVVGVGAAQVAGLDERSLRVKSAELAARRGEARQLESRERARLEGLLLLDSDGSERPLLPPWAAPQRPLASARDLDQLLALLDARDAGGLDPASAAELVALAAGQLPFPASPGAHHDVQTRARLLLKEAVDNLGLRVVVGEALSHLPPDGRSELREFLRLPRTPGPGR